MKFLTRLFQNKAIKSYGTAFVVIVVLTVFFFHYFSETVRINRIANESAQLEEIAMLSSRHIKDSIETYMRFTETAAKQVSELPNISRSDAFAVLSRIAEKTDADFMEIVYADGTRKSTEPGSFTAGGYSPHKSKSAIIASFINGHNYMTFIVPVKKKGAVIAEVRGSLKMDFFDSLTENRLLGKNGSFLLLKSDGTFISPLGKESEFASTENIFDFMQLPNIRASITLEQLLNTFNGGKELFFHYTDEDQTTFMLLTPIGISGWYAAILTPAELLASKSISVTSDTLMLLLQMIMIFTALTACIVYREKCHSKIISTANKMQETLIANIPCGVQKSRTDSDFTYEFASQGFAEMLGYDNVEEVISSYSKSFWVSIIPEDRAEAKESILSQLAENNRFEVVYRMRKKNGEIIYILCKGGTVNDKEGNKNAYAVTLDISYTQKTIEELSLSDKKYKIATENSDIFILEYDPTCDTLYTAPRCSEKFGLPLKTKKVTETFAKIVEHTPSEGGLLSLHKAFLNMLAAMKNGTESVSASHYILSQDGTRRFIATTHLTAVYGDHGKLLKVIGIIEDDTAAKEVENKFLKTEKYRQALANLYNRTYEYDLTNDRVIKGGEYYGGYINKDIADISVSDVKMYFTALFTHQDDQPIIQEILTEEGSLLYLAKGFSEVDLEYRNKTSLDSDEYRWKAAHVSIFIDPLDNSVRNIWYLKDITASVKKTEELKKMAENDPMTGIYNKKTTENLIIEKLSQNSGGKDGSIDALIMLDLDDFKNINDLMGHLFGDAVISEVAAGIKETFRSSDIIGRIGGDEFIIYMKDIPNREIAERKTREACSIIRKMRSGEVKEFLISASAGIAFCPDHGKSFDQLYNKADIALYRAKDLGKDNVILYDESMGTNFEQAKNAHNDIDTENSGAENFAENMPHSIFKILCDAKDINVSTKLVLELICKHFGFSRGYVFENTSSSKCRQTYEWCAEGILPESGKMDEIDYEETFPNLLQSFSQDKIYFYKGSDSKADLPSHYNIGHKNTGLAVAILDEGKYAGFIGFDCSDDIAAALTQRQISDILISSQMVAVFMLNAKSNKKTAAN